MGGRSPGNLPRRGTAGNTRREERRPIHRFPPGQDILLDRRSRERPQPLPHPHWQRPFHETREHLLRGQKKAPRGMRLLRPPENQRGLPLQQPLRRRQVQPLPEHPPGEHLRGHHPRRHARGLPPHCRLRRQRIVLPLLQQRLQGERLPLCPHCPLPLLLPEPFLRVRALPEEHPFLEETIGLPAVFHPFPHRAAMVQHPFPPSLLRLPSPHIRHPHGGENVRILHRRPPLAHLLRLFHRLHHPALHPHQLRQLLAAPPPLPHDRLPPHPGLLVRRFIQLCHRPGDSEHGRPPEHRPNRTHRRSLLDHLHRHPPRRGRHPPRALRCGLLGEPSASLQRTAVAPLRHLPCPVARQPLRQPLHQPLGLPFHLVGHHVVCRL